MVIYNATGVVETPILTVTKGIGALIISTNIAINQILNQRISVWVERAGKNKDIANDMLLKDFLLLATYGEDAIQSNAQFGTIAMCELTSDGGFIHLAESEVIKIQLKGLTATDLVSINGIEEPFMSHDILAYERKTMASENVNQDFDVKGYDILSVTKDASINEIAMTYPNGSVCKYSIFELETLSRSLDPVLAVNNNGTVVANLTDRLILPLKGISNINIRKNAGVLLNFSLRIDELDFNNYSNQR